MHKENCSNSLQLYKAMVATSSKAIDFQRIGEELTNLICSKDDVD